RVIFVVDRERCKHARPLLANELQGGVDGDAVYPGTELRAVLELVALVTGGKQGVLYRIFGLVTAPRNPQACRKPTIRPSRNRRMKLRLRRLIAARHSCHH